MNDGMQCDGQNVTAFTSEEQVAPAFGIESAESEANENHRRSHESSQDDAGEKTKHFFSFH